jgi:cardiolipin synthase
MVSLRDETMTPAAHPPAMHEEPNSRLNIFRSAPNLLTLLRICLAPFLVAAILEGHYALSFGLFVAAGLTDALDGTLARLLKQRSMFGQYLDPVADKLLLSTLFLVLMHQQLMPVTVTVLVFGRDVGILLVSALLYAAAGRREFRPSIFGKANTLAQVSAVAAVLLNQIFLAPWVGVVSTWALGATMVLTVASGLHYAWVASRRLGAPAAHAPVAK